MKKILFILPFLMLFFTACDVLQQVVQGDLGLNLNPNQLGVSKLLNAPPPVSTNFEEDANTEVEWLDDFEPVQAQFQDANNLSRTEQGGYILREGLFYLDTKSYCIKAGTYGPSMGDGYVYAPLKGPKANVIRKLVVQSYEREDITQQEVQQLIWAVIAGNKFKQMPESRKQLGYKLLNPLEIQQLNGGLWALAPDGLKATALKSVNPVMQRIYASEQKMRNLLNDFNTSYQQLEQVAVLTGQPTWGEEIRPTPSGRWAYHPTGFFIRYFPRNYRNTRVELYVPQKVWIQTDNDNRISTLSLSNGWELGFNYDNTNTMTTISLFAVDRGLVYEHILINKKPAIPFSTVSTPALHLSERFDVHLNEQEKFELEQLRAIETLMQGIRFKDANTGATVMQLITEGKHALLYQALQQATVSQQSGNTLRNFSQQVSRINQLNFNKQHPPQVEGIVYDPIEAVATPAVTSKQRILVAPTPKLTNTEGEACTFEPFDAYDPVYSKKIDGLDLRGSRKFIELVAKAITSIKTYAPEQYKELLANSKSPGFPVRGIGIDCKTGYNTIDRFRLVRLFIKNEMAYKTFDRYPEILATIILHEATHLKQAANYRLNQQASFEDFLSYYNSDLKIAQRLEREAALSEMSYLKKVMKQIGRKHPDYGTLYNTYLRVDKRYRSNYPDVNNNGQLDPEDFEIIRASA